MMSIRANEHTYALSTERKIPLNLNSLDWRIDSLLSSGMAKKEGDKIILNLKEMGFSKVCGRFRDKKLKLVVYGRASERAKNEIISAGGEVL